MSVNTSAFFSSKGVCSVLSISAISPSHLHTPLTLSFSSAPSISSELLVVAIGMKDVPALLYNDL